MPEEQDINCISLVTDDKYGPNQAACKIFERTIFIEECKSCLEFKVEEKEDDDGNKSE